MLGKIVVVVMLVAAVLVVAQQKGVLDKSGIVGSCEVVQSPAGDRSEWRACSEGILTGHPSLVADCTFQLSRRGYQYWRCPARTRS